jgi:hypothetical protein
VVELKPEIKLHMWNTKIFIHYAEKRNKLDTNKKRVEEISSGFRTGDNAFKSFTGIVSPVANWNT